ncbi:protein of unknown function [Tissierella praeacuta DSM 18095]|uniref:DUF5058 domain-containing protein n=1 Tax=Tissierella praeacuta DSM 18095 TaxID=1123404 RepID=A0A1M4TA47_9FIRM|nr:DUF5058 family protein [Tissierella praeacuta]SHE41117.1 protein of unknown function [Tissierella praeacuta DSM 18095]SUP04827.1 Uncharacterised protein [Tissierella praeacuta]
MDYLKIANSFPMWLAAGLAISLALFQAIIFAKKSYSTGKEIGLTEEQMKSAIKSSFITSLGPSFVILTGLLSLLVTVGGPMAWMRLSFIGSVMFEMMAAGFGTEAVGVKMGIDPMTNIAFANAVWTMILGSLGWIVFSTLTADKMEKVQTKFSKGDKGLLSIISITAMLGSFGSLVSGHLMAMNKNTIAALAGGAIMLILSPIAEKKNIKWLKEWALTIALFGGMIIAALI